MAFRLLDQKPQYRDSLGNLLAGGSLNFYITSTTTPKNVYSDKTLGTSLGSTITLDSDGRHSEDIWLAEDEAYRVIVKDADDVAVWQLEDVRSLDSSVSADLPDASDATDGQVLASDGTSGGWFFTTIVPLPSMTGNQGKYLTNDGEAPSWASFAEADTPTEVVVDPSASGYVWADGILEVWGTGTAPTASALHTSVAITFSKTFDSAPYHISVIPILSSGVSSNSPSGFPTWSVASPSTTGTTVHFFVGEENTGGTDTLISTIPFTYWAKGPRATDPGA